MGIPGCWTSSLLLSCLGIYSTLVVGQLGAGGITSAASHSFAPLLRQSFQALPQSWPVSDMDRDDQVGKLVAEYPVYFTGQSSFWQFAVHNGQRHVYHQVIGSNDNRSLKEHSLFVWPGDNRQMLSLYVRDGELWRGITARLPEELALPDDFFSGQPVLAAERLSQGTGLTLISAEQAEPSLTDEQRRQLALWFESMLDLMLGLGLPAYGGVAPEVYHKGYGSLSHHRQVTAREVLAIYNGSPGGGSGIRFGKKRKTGAVADFLWSYMFKAPASNKVKLESNEPTNDSPIPAANQAEGHGQTPAKGYSGELPASGAIDKKTDKKTTESIQSLLRQLTMGLVKSGNRLSVFGELKACALVIQLHRAELLHIHSDVGHKSLVISQLLLTFLTVLEPDLNSYDSYPVTRVDQVLFNAMLSYHDLILSWATARILITERISSLLESQIRNLKDAPVTGVATYQQLQHDPGAPGGLLVMDSQGITLPQTQAESFRQWIEAELRLDFPDIEVRDQINSFSPELRGPVLFNAPTLFHSYQLTFAMRGFTGDRLPTLILPYTDVSPLTTIQAFGSGSGDSLLHGARHNSGRLELLPKILLDLIVGYLNDQDRVCLSATCHRLMDFIDSYYLPRKIKLAPVSIEGESLIEFSPDSRHMAMMAKHNSINILTNSGTGWEKKTETKIPCEEIIHHLGFSPDSRYLVIATGSNRRLLDLTVNKEPTTLAHAVWWSCINAFSPCGQYLVVDMGYLEVYRQGETGYSKTDTFKAGFINSGDFSPDSSCFALDANDEILILCLESTGQLLQKQRIDEFKKYRLQEVKFFDDHNLMAKGQKKFSCFQKRQSENWECVLDYGYGVQNYTWQPKTGLIALACSEKKVVLYRKDKPGGLWKLMQTLLYPHQPGVVAFSPQGIYLGVGTGSQLHIYTQVNKDGKWIWEVRSSVGDHVHDIQSIVFSDNSKWMASTSTRRAVLYRLWLYGRWVETAVLDSLPFAKMTLRFSPDSAYITIVNHDVIDKGKILLFRLEEENNEQPVGLKRP